MMRMVVLYVGLVAGGFTALQASDENPFAGRTLVVSDTGIVGVVVPPDTGGAAEEGVTVPVLMSIADYRLAIDSLKGCMQEPSFPVTYRIRCIRQINRYYREIDGTAEAMEYLGTVEAGNRGTEVEAAAGCLAVPLLVRQRQYDAARDKCRYVHDNFGGTYWAEESLFNLGELYLNRYEDRERAEECFALLIRDYPASEYVKQARRYLGER